MSLSESEFSVLRDRMAANCSGVEQAAPKPEKRRGRMNKLETAYAANLAERLADGAIYWWAFEPVKLRLADGAWYCPDFAVLDGVDGLSFIETKGFWREAARIRIKVAADKYPFRFVAVTKHKRTGEWEYETFGRRA